jgi:transposase-like protein
MDTPGSLLEAVAYFSDPDRAHDYFVAVRWPNGVACPRMGCGSADVQYIKTRKRWRCKDCKREFTAKVGTIFEDSPISFTKWLPAIWLLSAARNGISSCEVARAIHVTQKTAWFMLHRIRLGMQAESFELLSGEVEVDETYIGPKARSMNRRAAKSKKSRGPGYSKTVVMGMRERGGKVRAMVVKDTKRGTLLPKVFESVSAGSTVYTDALGSYHDLRRAYVHEVINHAEKYVDGRVHTNSIENFWSVLKRTIGGTYICPRPEHLDAYLDEQIFRFNERESTDGPRFKLAAKGADGKRLTYKALTASHPRWRLKPGRKALSPGFIGDATGKDKPAT